MLPQFIDSRSVLHESKQIDSILEYKKKFGMVVIDLDNTVIESEEELGSDQWITKLTKDAMEALPQKKHEAAKWALNVYHAVQSHLKVRPVEKQVVNIIKNLQDMDIPVIGLTARDPKIIKETFQQLNYINVRFYRQWGQPRFELSVKKNNTTIFDQGIVFCGDNDKGECLEALFNKLQYLPRHVLFIDDKQYNVESVKKTIDRLHLDFDGIRYGYLDKKVSQLDMLKANVQLKQISHLLPEKAKQALNSLSEIFVRDRTSPLNLFFAKPVKDSPTEQNLKSQEYSTTKP